MSPVFSTVQGTQERLCNVCKSYIDLRLVKSGEGYDNETTFGGTKERV